MAAPVLAGKKDNADFRGADRQIEVAENYAKMNQSRLTIATLCGGESLMTAAARST